MKHQNSLAPIALAMILVACAGDKKPAASALPTNNNTVASSMVNPKLDDDGTRGTLTISDEIRKACGLTDSDTFFAFDSAKVRRKIEGSSRNSPIVFPREPSRVAKCAWWVTPTRVELPITIWL